jgi:hypothetical protein
MWQEWTNGFLGLWVIVLGFFNHGIVAVVLILTGALIGVIGFWGGLDHHRQRGHAKISYM